LIVYARSLYKSTTSTRPSPKSKSGRHFEPPALAFRQAVKNRWLVDDSTQDTHALVSTPST
jgi:hypothetical protein